MAVKLYVTGLPEPFYIDREVAEAIQELKVDESKPPSTPIVIEEVWTGSKKDVKHLVWPPTASQVGTDKDRIIAMDDYEAKQYEKRVVQYQMEAEANGFPTHEWRKYYLQSRGAVRLHVENERLIETVTDIHKYPEITKEIQAYYKYLDKKAYAEKQKLKELEKTAEQYVGEQ